MTAYQSTYSTHVCIGQVCNHITQQVYCFRCICEVIIMAQLVPAKNTYGACGQGEREREREAKVVCREEKMGFILTERKTTAFFQNSFFFTYQ